MTGHGPAAVRPWLFVVSDRRRLCAAAGRPVADAHRLLVAQAGAAAAAGVTAFQVRERDLDGRALLYDLADVLESIGEAGRALAVFGELDADVPGYRDVAARIERLGRVQARG